MLLIKTLSCRHAVITLICTDIHCISENICSRITFSFHFLIFDCTHTQTNFAPFVLIIPSLPLPPCSACPQLITYNGFYDFNLEVVGMESVQIVGSMTLSSFLGRHILATKLTSVVCICSMSYHQLETIYSTYLTAVCRGALGGHPVCSNTGKVHTLATSMVRLYFEVSLVHVQVWCSPSGVSISYTALRCGVNYYISCY